MKASNREHSVFWLNIGLSLSLAAFPSLANWNISQGPLFLAPSVDPNIMFILDDSGSMQWEIMPDEGIYSYFMYPRASTIYGGTSDYTNWVPSFRDEFVYSRWTRSSQTNKTYYNPAVTYVPWSTETGSTMANADPTAAYHNPILTAKGTRNLTANNTQSAGWDRCTGKPPTGCVTVSESETFYPAVYYNYNGNGEWVLGNYTKVEIKSTTTSYSGDGRSNRTDCTNGVCTYDQEIQNFANWYTYYRSRILASRAGIGKAFSQQGGNLRVGFSAINKGSTTIDGVSTDTIIMGVRPFTGTDRQSFFSNLYGHVIPTSGTPLRRALNSAGQYFSRTDNKGPWSTSPGSDGGTDTECRASYSILMTDGYWNGDQAGTTAARSNNDGTNGPTITGPASASYTYSATSPFTDTNSNTLADVAMYYWKNDLRTNMTNSVPTSTVDPAFWQHMTTFSVGLGVEGSIDPDNAFDAIQSGATITWPTPSETGTTQNIDDLLHAAVNSRGGFFSAADPETFANKLNSILTNISGRTEASSSSVATNSRRLDTNTVIYQARFDSSKWTGEFLAYRVNSDGSAASTPSWDGGQKVTDQGPSNRAIFSYNPTATTTKGIVFSYSNLNTTQQALFPGGSSQVEYLKGDASNEARNGGSFRNRTGSNRLLGDLVNSDPWFIGDISFGYQSLSGTEGSEYLTYRESARYKDRKPLVAIGGNDGMLHAFNANVDTVADSNAGKEVFAYVPHTLFNDNKLASLTSTSYIHQFFVDGSPIAGDAYFDADNDTDNEWRTVLVGTLGAGGKGIFALDTTFLDPSDDTYATAESSFSAQRVLWEINSSTTDFSQLGFTMGQASIVRMANGQFAAVFGNGYNSVNHRAVLYVVDIKTGALIKAFDTGIGSSTALNGMSTPLVVDANGDRIADAIYAGDLRGNMWKIDVSNSSVSQWDFAFKQGTTPKPLFSATDSSNNVQPITAKPQASKHPTSGVMIYFGTGKYFESADNNTTSPKTQSFYGIYDSCIQLAGSNNNCNSSQPSISRSSNLVQQTIVAEGTVGDFDLRVTSANVTDRNNYLANKKGWYMDLLTPPSSTAIGERVVSQALLRQGRIVFVTLIPGVNPCSPGGTSWLMEFDALTGNRLSATPFDITGDRIINTDDMTRLVDTNNDSQITNADTKLAASGKKSQVGIIKSPGVISAGNIEYKYTSGSTGALETTVESVEGGAGRMSWRQLR